MVPFQLSGSASSGNTAGDSESGGNVRATFNSPFAVGSGASATATNSENSMMLVAVLIGAAVFVFGLFLALARPRK